MRGLLLYLHNSRSYINQIHREEGERFPREPPNLHEGVVAEEGGLPAAVQEDKVGVSVKTDPTVSQRDCSINDRAGSRFLVSGRIRYYLRAAVF